MLVQKLFLLHARHELVIASPPKMVTGKRLTHQVKAVGVVTTDAAVTIRTKSVH